MHIVGLSKASKTLCDNEESDAQNTQIWTGSAGSGWQHEEALGNVWEGALAVIEEKRTRHGGSAKLNIVVCCCVERACSS